MTDIPDIPDHEWLEGIRDNNPLAFTPATVERLTRLAPTMPLADRLLAHREKAAYDHASVLPTSVAGDYFQPGDLLQAYRLHSLGRWPAEAPPGPRRYRSPMLTLQPGMRGVAFYDTVTRAAFARALHALHLYHTGHAQALSELRFLTKPDGTPYYDHAQPTALRAALTALAETLLDTLKQGDT